MNIQDAITSEQANIETVDAQINLEAKLKDAMKFINYNIKEGIYDPEQFEGMTDKELIAFAENEEDRAMAAYESSLEE